MVGWGSSWTEPRIRLMILRAVEVLRLATVDVELSVLVRRSYMLDV